ncbi:MAG: hypothetical protein ABWX92_14880 [Mycetocola sp.]
MPDITDTLKADSTQLNAIDFPPGTSRTYTVESVRVVPSAKDRPVNIRLAEDPDGREFRPSKGMRRILAACWTPDSDKWVGKRLTIYADPSVRYAGKSIGGLKVSHVSHIDAAKKLPLRESESVTTIHTVQPLPDAPTPTKPPVEPIEVRAPKAIEWFASKGVPASSLEAHVSKPVAEWSHADLDSLMAARDELTGATS